MRIDGSTAVKREHDGQDDAPPYFTSKRIKQEDDSSDDSDGTSTIPPRKPTTRGVEQVSYPQECRPTSALHEAHRAHFITEVKKEFALQGKHATHIRFLDDAVAIDWIFDKSAIRELHCGGLQCDTSKVVDSEKQLESGPPECPWDNKVGIPGLHHAKSGAVVSISRGSMSNPILVSDSDDLDELDELDVESDIENGGLITLDGKQHPGTTTSAPELNVSMPGSEVLVHKANLSPVAAFQEGSSGGSEQAEASPSTRNITYAPTATESASIASVTLHPSHKSKRRASFSSSTSISSTSSSSSSIRSLASSAHRSKDQRPSAKPTDPSRSVLAHERYETLRKIDWRNHRSTVIMWNLPCSSTVTDVCQHLGLNGLSSDVIQDLQIHVSDSKMHKPIASILFRNAEQAASATRVLRSSGVPFFTSSGSRTESVHDVHFDPYQPPKRWKEEDAAHLPEACCPGVPTPDSPVHVHSKQSELVPGPIRFSSSDGQPSHQKHNLSAAPSPIDRTLASVKRSSSNSRRATLTGDIPRSEREGQSTSSRFSPRLTGYSLRRPSRNRLPSQRADVTDLTGTTSDSDTHDSSDSHSSPGSSSENETDSSEEPRFRSAHHRTSGIDTSRPRNVELASVHVHQVKQIQLPVVKHGRARRLLLPKSTSSPLMSVTMRGDVQFIDQTTKERLVNLSLPAKAMDVHRLEDACLINETAVLGFSKGEKGQISVVSYADEHLHEEEIKSGKFSTFTDGANVDPNVAIRDAFEFLSGGFDKTVQHWHVSCVPGIDEKPRFSSRVSPITRGPLNSKISALLHLPERSRVLAAAGYRLWALDAERQAEETYVHFSNLILQLHLPYKKDPNVFVVEVDHLLAQMQVFDLRKARPGYGRPVLEFGYPDSATESRHIRSHKRRGDTTVTHFARGYQDGMVCIWDYRNIKKPAILNKCENPITHTVFAGRKTRNLWSFARDKVQFIETG